MRPYGDEAMLIMRHRIWCVWSVCSQRGRPFDQRLTWWFLRFKETRNRGTGGKNTDARTYFSLEKPERQKKRSIWSLVMFKKSSQLLCFVFVGLSVGPVPLDACYRASTRIRKHEVAFYPRHVLSYRIEILDFDCAICWIWLLRDSFLDNRSNLLLIIQSFYV